MQDISTEVTQTGRQREGVLSYWDFINSLKHSWNLKKSGGNKKPFLFGKNNPN